MLVAQCYWYRGWGAVQTPDHSTAEEDGGTDGSKPPSDRVVSSETSPLLQANRNALCVPDFEDRSRRTSLTSGEDRSRSPSAIPERVQSRDAAHLSPTVPLHASRGRSHADFPDEDISAEEDWTLGHRTRRHTRTKAVLFNAAAVLVVCAAGVLGWWLSWRSQPDSRPDDEPKDEELFFNVQGQVYGYICAVLYLASRIPQLWQNYKRKKTDGLSILFFLFACIGNLTYVLSIFAYDPKPLCKHGKCRKGEDLEIYGKYILVNLSWLVGSFGTLLLDLGVFVQFFIYRDNSDDDVNDENEQWNGRHETTSDYTDETVVADVYRIQGQRPRREQREWDHYEGGH